MKLNFHDAGIRCVLDRRALLALFVLLGHATLLVRPVRGDVFITEIMAANTNTLADEDGDYPDWVEFYNSGPGEADLDGYYLTDGENLWRFPAVSLPAGEFLVVFASEKNRRQPGGELHANFRLTSRGEYLALLEPDASTVVFHFSPKYPEQLPDVSYGVSQQIEETTLIAESDSARAFVPTSGSLGSTWTQPGFSDGAWTVGPTGVGFDTGTDYTGLIRTDIESQMRSTNASCYIRVPFTAQASTDLDRLTLDMKYDDGFVAYLNGQEVARRNAPSSVSWNSAATAEHGQPDVSVMNQNFDSTGTSYTLTAHGPDLPPRILSGGPTGSYLELMRDNEGSLNNTIGFRHVPGPTGAIFAEFDYRMPVGGDADGFGFALLETSTWGTTGPDPSQQGFVWERPQVPDAFAVGFDIWPAGEENSVSINWNGAEISSEFITAFELHNGDFNRVNVELVQDGNDTLVTVTITPDYHGNRGSPLTVFNQHRIAGMNLQSARVAFGGRTGGAFTSVDLDNIEVEFTPGSRELEFETFDITDSLELLVDGPNVLAIQGLNRSSNDGDFLILPELRAIDDDGVQLASRLYFTEPTPSWYNGDGLPGVSERCGFSHEAGAYPTSFSLTLSAGAPGSVIRYTTDGSLPTATSTVYTSAISISTTRLIKARVFTPGMLPGPTVTKLYMRLSSNVRDFNSNLPIVVVDTRGGGIGSGSFRSCQALIIDVDPDTGRSEMTGLPDFGGAGGIKQRGSSSSGFDKKMYAFEVQDEVGEDLDVSILGMPEQSDWILYAPYSDKSLMRNYLAYKWSNDAGRYAVRTRFVEMFLNTGTGNLSYSSHYVGVYVLMEKIKRDPRRVDIDRLTPGDNSAPEITGGYIIKKDRLDPGDSGFTTNSGQTLAYYYPKERDISAAQANYLRNYLNTFEAALYGANFRDPVNGYARYFDMDASIDHHIMVELCKNIDGYRLSTFAYKPRNGKLQMGPIWDYNLSLGNANYLEGWNPQGWYYPLISSNQYPWYPRLFQDPDYAQRYIDRWTELRQGPFTEAKLLQDVDDAAAQIDEAQERNFQRWDILGTYIWPNEYIANTWQEEITWMKGWLSGRLAWMDGNYPTPPLFSQESSIITPGFEVALSAPTGTIYYTLDGSDPRLSGGSISPAATEYGSSNSAVLLSPATHSRVRALVPVNGAAGLSWTQRGYNDSSWSLSTTGIGVGYENSSGYESYIDLDVGGQMFDTNMSVYIRYEFDVVDPSLYAFLTLRMRYDDGFIAYLNGRRVTDANGPASPQWDSGATAQHDDGASVQFESFNISADVDALVAGTNVLAIHGLNRTIDSSDALFQPELLASGVFSGDAIVLDDFTRFTARTYDTGEWSGPSEATFVLDDAQFLRITELMYHPPNPPQGSAYGDEDYEFLEIQNTGATTVDLRGVRLTKGVDFDFTYGDVTSLAPGDYVIVVANRAAFEERYDPTGILIAGEYEGQLENLGENVRLRNGIDEIIQEFIYRDFWHPTTDGDGHSLVIIDPIGEVDTWNVRESWIPSDLAFGSPGTGESVVGGRQLPGDANQDSVLDIGDVVATLLLVYRGTLTPPCDGATVADGGNVPLLDFTDDTAVDQSDAIYLLTHLFSGGAPHVLGTNCIRIDGCPTVVCTR